jgi:uncharacterized protein (TIGR01777 family)
MRVTVTGATGLIGRRLVARLKDRGDDVTVLSRNPDRAGEALGVRAVAWDPLAGPALAQRWNGEVKRRIRESREVGTHNLVEGMRSASPRPGALVSASGVDYYGPRGDEEVTEEDPPADDFLAQVCVAWEREAQMAEDYGVRVVRLRTGVVLSREGGALATMLPPFKLGVGGPVAGGRQWMPWLHLDDVTGLYLAALDDERWSGPVNACTPTPATNKEFSKALGRALHRPAVAPVPAFALRILYGDMAEVVTAGRRAIPKRALELGYAYEHPDLDEALRSALGKGPARG